MTYKENKIVSKKPQLNPRSVPSIFSGNEFLDLTLYCIDIVLVNIMQHYYFTWCGKSYTTKEEKLRYTTRSKLCSEPNTDLGGVLKELNILRLKSQNESIHNLPKIIQQQAEGVNCKAVGVYSIIYMT